MGLADALSKLLLLPCHTYTHMRTQAPSTSESSCCCCCYSGCCECDSAASLHTDHNHNHNLNHNHNHLLSDLLVRTSSYIIVSHCHEVDILLYRETSLLGFIDEFLAPETDTLLDVLPMINLSKSITLSPLARRKAAQMADDKVRSVNVPIALAQKFYSVLNDLAHMDRIAIAESSEITTSFDTAAYLLHRCSRLEKFLHYVKQTYLPTRQTSSQSSYFGTAAGTTVLWM
jgi:hypothetical protein